MRVSHNMDRISDLQNRGRDRGVTIQRAPTGSRKSLGSPQTSPPVTIINSYPCSIHPLRSDMRNQPQGETVIQEWMMIGPTMLDSSGMVLFKMNDIVLDGAVQYIMVGILNTDVGQLEITLHLGEVGNVQSH